MALFAKGKGIWSDTGVTLAGLGALLALAAVTPTVAKTPWGARAGVYFSLARNRSLMTLADDENYYDAIQKKKLMRTLQFVPERGFRLYRYAPDKDYRTGIISTNHAGWVGPDRPMVKPAHTWRIAVVGDSLGTGYRIPYSDTFPFKLERRLNAELGERNGETFQVMDFACPGYSLTQIVDTAIEDVPAYSPDVYVVELSERSLARQWDAQLLTLGNKGIDPKYDFIRRVFAKAHVRRRDSVSAAHTKLAPYRVEILRGALQALQQSAARRNVPVLLVLFPSVEPGDLSSQRIHDASDVYAGLGLPVIDLTDAFDGETDTRPLLATQDDPSNLDVHPSGLGYTRVLEDLYRKLETQPGLWASLTGEKASGLAAAP